MAGEKETNRKKLTLSTTALCDRPPQCLTALPPEFLMEHYGEVRRKGKSLIITASELAGAGSSKVPRGNSTSTLSMSSEKRRGK